MSNHKVNCWEELFNAAFGAYRSGNFATSLEYCLHAISRYSCDHPKDKIIEWRSIAINLELEFLGKSTADPCEKCSCVIPNNIQIVRWFILRAFILYRIFRGKRVAHDHTNAKCIRDTLDSATKLIHLHELCNEEEFSYLKSECRLKLCLIEIDYLDVDPWFSYKKLKRSKKTWETSNQDDVEQGKVIGEYLTKVLLRCMAWYIRRR